MITLEQAKSLKRGDIIHSNYHKNSDGTCMRWRVNGRVKLWKRNADKVQVPIKYGLRDYDYLHEGNLNFAHLPNNCPRENKENV